MEMRTVIKRILFSIFCLILVSSCAKDKDNREYIVITNGENYQLIFDNLPSDENEKYEVSGNKITFIDEDIKISKKDCYTYQDIDFNDFLEYIVEKNQLDIQNKKLILIGYRYTSSSNDFIGNGLPGTSVIYILENQDLSWTIYSYVGIMKKEDVYYSFKNEQPYKTSNRIDYVVNQDFDRPHASFALVDYDRKEWTKEKFIEWFKLNNFDFDAVE